MRKERRGFERERQDVRRRLMDDDGCFVARAESCDEASGGIAAAFEDAGAPTSKFFRLHRVFDITECSCNGS